MNVFRRLFHIYPGEEKSAALFALLGFLWAFAVTSGLKFADALFLIHVGPDSLPTAYTFTACANIILASFLIYAFHSIPVHRIFLFVMTLAICFYSSVWFYLTIAGSHPIPYLWFALKIFGSVLFTISITCYWTFIDQYHHLQDAKRLYSLFNSMIFLGITVTGLTMHFGWVDFLHLTLIIVTLLICACLTIFNIHRKKLPVHDETEQDSDQNEISPRKIFKEILGSRFTLFLMAGNFITYILLVITEYNYLFSFDKHFDPGTTITVGGEENAAITQYLGKWIAIVSISNLIFGLFAYSRIVRKWGVGSLLLFTPLILLFTFGGWTFSNALIFPIVGLFIAEGTLYVIDDNNFTLLLNAVPSKLKYKIRIFIESFFEPIGMLVSSVLLSINWLNSRVLGFLLSLLLVLVVLGVKANYLQAIYKNLSQNAIHFQRSLTAWFKLFTKNEKASSEKSLLTILSNGNEPEQNFALQGLLNINDETTIARLLNILDKLPSKTKIRFVEHIGDSRFAKDPIVLEYLNKWSNHERDHALKSSILYFLACNGLLKPEKAHDLIHNSDLKLRAAAILSLEKSWDDFPKEVNMRNQALAAQELKKMLNTPEEESISMGLSVLGVEANPHDIDFLLPFLENPSLPIARSAASAFAKISDKNSVRHAGLLIRLMNNSGDNEFRLSCLQALGKMNDISIVNEIIGASVHFRPNERRFAANIIAKMGQSTVPTLLSITKDTKMHDRCRILAGRILGELSLPLLRENLFGIIDTEIKRAYFYFYHSQTIQKNHPEHNLELLKDELFSEYHSVLDFIIQLLATAGEIEDSELLSRSIRSTNTKTRSQVIETLEKTCETKIFRLLDPLVSELPISEKIAYYIRSGLPTLNLDELLYKLSTSISEADRMVAIATIYKLQLPGWQQILQKNMDNPGIFRNFGKELLET